MSALRPDYARRLDELRKAGCSVLVSSGARRDAAARRGNGSIPQPPEPSCLISRAGRGVVGYGGTLDAAVAQALDRWEELQGGLG